LIRQGGGDADPLQRLDISHSKARYRVQLVRELVYGPAMYSD
jgi:hypothetical protein